MRSFIAIEIPPGVKTELAALIERLRVCRVRAAWAKPDTMHLTLHFLGEVSEDHIATIRESLAMKTQSIPPFELRVAGTGAFPNVLKPSVIWVGLAPLDGGLDRLHKLVQETVEGAGLSCDRKAFRPHVTLARMKERDRTGELARLLGAESGFTAGSFRVESVTLFSSRLTRAGAIHNPLATFDLQGG